MVRPAQDSAHVLHARRHVVFRVVCVFLSGTCIRAYERFAVGPRCDRVEVEEGRLKPNFI